MAKGTDIYYISGSQPKSEPVIRLKTQSGKCWYVPVDVLVTLRDIYGTSRPSVGWNITADSLPDYDEWGWDEYWGCAEWMLWHQLNVQQYGKPTANQKFMEAWAAQDGLMSPYNWCKYNTDFANYFKAQGINVGWLLSNLIVAADNVTQDGLSTLQDTSSAVASVARVVRVAAPWVAVGAGIWAIDKYAFKLFPDEKRRA